MEPKIPEGFLHVLPALIPAVFGLVALCVDLFLGRGKNKIGLAMIGAGGSALAALAAVALWSGDAGEVVLAGTIVTSRFGAVLSLAVLLAVAVIGFATVHHGRAAVGRDGAPLAAPAPTLAHGELYGLLLFAASGMTTLLVANDLVTFFVALEVLSLAAYCLTGVDRRRERSAEGAMKYFVLGAFASGFFLYGISLVYGATHTLRLDEIARASLEGGDATLAMAGAAFLLVGLLFKVGAVPFHAWTPDAYEGAPAAVTGFMSVAVKVAAFGGAIRVLVALGEGGALGAVGGWALWVVAGLTMILGNAGALSQRNPRRLLAYSAIAHTGYVLVGLVAVARVYDPGHPLYGLDAAGPGLVDAGRDAVAGVIFYMVGYGVSNLTAFSVLCHLERSGEEVDDVSDLAGLARTQPGVALAMTLAMVSLAGIPATAGFLGKLWVFRAGVAVGDIGLVVLGVITSVLSLYYYLRVVVAMYMREPGERLPGEPVGPPAPGLVPDPRRWASRLALGAGAVLTVVLGVYPGAWLLGLIVEGATAIL